MDIARKISELRNERNMSAEKLAEKANVSESTIFKIEGGKVDPKFSTVLAILDGLNISIKLD